MAKFDIELKGNFDHFLNYLEDSILKGSLSASYEAGSDYHIDDVKVAIRAFERYSILGENRVSLHFTLIAKGETMHLTAITSGGSQAMLFKINRFGEDSFLKKLENEVYNYIKNHRI